jgi:exodeoxyribonuclease X
MAIIRVCDFETTGLEADAQVVELGVTDYDTEAGTVLHAQIGSWLFHADPIPPAARAVHHITADMVAHCAPFTRQGFDSCMEDMGPFDALAFHNAAYDLQFLPEPGWPVVCTYKAALRLWPEAPGHSNGTLRYWLEDMGKLQLGNPALALPPHRAGPDTYVTAHLLHAIMAEGVTAKAMTGWTKQPAILPTCPIGQHKGKAWCDVDTGFLQWMLRTPDMNPDYHWNARRELDRRNGGSA